MTQVRLITAAVAAAVCVLAAGCSAPVAPADAKIAPTVVDWDLSPAQIKASCAQRIAQAKRRARALADARGVRTFANTVLALEDISSDLGDGLVAQTFLSQVAPAKPVREAALACQNDVSAFFAEAGADPDIYKGLLDAQKSGTAADDYDRALTALWISQYEQAGAALPPKKRSTFIALSKQLSGIQYRFNQNIGDDVTTITVDKRAAAGLPAEFVGGLKSAGAGSYSVPVNDSTSPIVLSSASDEDLRKRFYFAYTNIQVPGNVRLLEQAIAIRFRLARLLGFDSWAAYQMHTRSEKDPARVVAFLRDLDHHVLPAARRDIARLAALKAREIGRQGAVLEPWDVAYYLNELQRSQYALDQNEVKRYFPAPHTVAAVLAFYQHILGVTFSKVQPANAWSHDVTEFAVTDTASGKFIGTFLLDLYPRPGKPGGAFNAPIVSVRRLPDGTYRPPVSAMIVSDWPAPDGAKPALLTHDDVVVFFHEFGHCMAALLADVPYESLSDFNSDFVEAPSQMLENFAWDRSILKQITSNVDTGAPMPDALIKKLVAARCVTDRLCNGYAASRQLLFSLVDLDYHMSGPRVDTTAAWARASRDDTPLALADGAHPQAQFTHETSGYDAGYYVYMWSLVYAQDMFTAFQAGGVQSPAVGLRYRQSILAPARTYSPDEEVRNFLGRAMSTSAFYKGFAGD